MFDFLKRKKNYILKRREACLFIEAVNTRNPDKLRIYARDIGAPLFFSQEGSSLIGRCGIPKTGFLEKYTMVALLKKVREYVARLQKQGVKLKLSSANLSETDHHKLIEYLTTSGSDN